MSLTDNGQEENKFSFLDIAQASNAEINRLNKELSFERSKRMDSERLLRECATQVAEFHTNLSKQQKVMASQLREVFLPIFSSREWDGPSTTHVVSMLNTYIMGADKVLLPFLDLHNVTVDTLKEIVKHSVDKLVNLEQLLTVKDSEMDAMRKVSIEEHRDLQLSREKLEKELSARDSNLAEMKEMVRNAKVSEDNLVNQLSSITKTLEGSERTDIEMISADGAILNLPIVERRLWVTKAIERLHSKYLDTESQLVSHRDAFIHFQKEAEQSKLKAHNDHSESILRLCRDTRESILMLHTDILKSVNILCAKASLAVTQSNAVQSNLITARDEMSAQLSTLKIAMHKDKNVLLANHVVEMAAAKQSIAAQQRRLEEISERLARALAREGMLKRELKAKEGELEVRNQLTEQREKDFQRKSATLEDVRSRLSSKANDYAAARDALVLERERAAELREQIVGLNKQIESSTQEVKELKDRIHLLEVNAKHECEMLKEENQIKINQLTMLHSTEISELKAIAAKASNEGSVAESSLYKMQGILKSAQGEVRLLQNIVNEQTNELLDMRTELKRAKGLLEEGLKKWSDRDRPQIYGTSGFTPPKQQVYHHGNFPPDFSDIPNADTRIRQLEAENRALRSACEQSLNQSVELMEALHRRAPTINHDSMTTQSMNHSTMN